MKHQWQRRVTAACLFLASGLCSAADAGVYGQVTVATDYLFRGVSQTMSGVALQGELGYEHESGWYGYAWASNVRFSDDGATDDGARTEINTGAGFARSLSERVSFDIGANLYLFPGTKPGFDYDYLEWYGTVAVDERHTVTIGYSDDVFNTAIEGTFWSVGTGRDLTDNVGLSLKLGHFDLEQALGTAYEFAEVALTGTAHAVGWRLSYSTTSSEARELFDKSITGKRVVLSLSLFF